MSELTDALRRAPPRNLKLVGVAAAAIALAIVAVGVLSRVHANQTLKTWTDVQAVPTVTVILPETSGGQQTLVLPGDVQAFNSAAIHARVSGYLKRWDVDIGASVKAGQVLAEVDTPDLDQQMAQAKADLNAALANETLAQSTAQRWGALLAKDAVSRQAADEKSGDLAAKSAMVGAARANLQRLRALEAFKRITSPFNGVVTSRTAEIGQLIAAGTPTDPPLFTVSDEHRVRIYVNVPQTYTAQIKSGVSANITAPEYPQRVFHATIVNTSKSVNAQNGSLLAELQVDNADGALKPGEYSQVKFDLPSNSAVVQVPASALLFRHSGMVVATVSPDNHVAMKPLTIARDLGGKVEIATGLQPSDRIVDNPADTLRDGDLVRISGASAEATARRIAGHG
jgi:RND family efflux transporter MFP subunit